MEALVFQVLNTEHLRDKVNSDIFNGLDEDESKNKSGQVYRKSKGEDRKVEALSRRCGKPRYTVLHSLVEGGHESMEEETEKRKKLAIVVQGGTIDKLYCAFILASTAVAIDMEAHLYFTFWGLQMLVKGAMEKAGLPAIYQHLEETMQENLKKMNYPSPYEMLKRLTQSSLFKMYACSPTMKMFGVKPEDLIPEIEEIVGAATFLEIAADADITLFI
jgi:peroxiredoxin family protein